MDTKVIAAIAVLVPALAGGTTAQLKGGTLLYAQSRSPDSRSEAQRTQPSPSPARPEDGSRTGGPKLDMGRGLEPGKGLDVGGGLETTPKPDVGRVRAGGGERNFEFGAGVGSDRKPANVTPNPGR